MPTDPASPEFLIAEKRAERLWGRMTFEVGVLSTRMNWMISSQAFLFAAFFLGLSRLHNQVLYAELLLFFVPLVGVVICVIMSIYINTANLILAQCRAELAATRQLFPDALQDQVDRDAGALSGRLGAQTATNMLVVLFIIFWLLAVGVLIANIGTPQG